jgi:exodeoxyribonuclease-3
MPARRGLRGRDGQTSYNGVAIADEGSKTSARSATAYDTDARLIAATTHGIRVICVYVPNGQSSTRSASLPRGSDGCARIRSQRLRPTPRSCCRDMNVTPDDRDVWSPAEWAGKIHCSPAERTALAELVGFGLTDLFRMHHPDGGVYSWWDYRGVSFFKNRGLRIDVIYGTAPIAARCTACVIDRDARKGATG